MRRLIILMLCMSAPAQAEELGICYNYDCAATAKVSFRAGELVAAGKQLLRSGDAAGEREAIARIIGQFETIAGQQTPTWADKGRNINDDGVNGRMDCIDESTNTAAYLRLLEKRGWLRFHRVLDRVKRAPLLVNDHWTARIVEERSGQEFAVDSWFFDNGGPAFIVPLEAWLKGAEPNE